jgi:hypothetical protein
VADHEGREKNPLHEFFDEFRNLHLYAGRPSTRHLAREASRGRTSISHTTVHEALSGKRLPRWDYAKTLIDLMGGEVEHFHKLWVAAADYSAGATTAKASALAGASPVREPLAGGGAPDADELGSISTASPARTPGASLVPRDESGKSLSTESPWSLYHYWPDAPPAIQLLKAAIRDGRDANQLLWEIVYHDPRASSPAVALVAENDFDVALEIMSTLAKREHRRATDLLDDLAVGQPESAAKLIRMLVRDSEIRAKWLVQPAIRMAELKREVDVAPIVLRALVGQDDAANLSAELCEWAASDDRHVVLGDVIAGIVRRKADQPDGVRLLDALWAVDREIGSRVFVQVVGQGSDGPGRRDRDHRLVLAVVALRSRYCPAMMMMSLKTEATTTRGLGSLLLTLADEELLLAARVALAISKPAPRTVTRMIAGSDKARLDTAVQLVLSMARYDAATAARVAAAWTVSSYPQVLFPLGWVIDRMSIEDPEATATMLELAVPLVPKARGSHTAGDLDRHSRNEIMARICPYLPYETQRKIRSLL